jgi:hypothetical protein
VAGSYEQRRNTVEVQITYRERSLKSALRWISLRNCVRVGRGVFTLHGIIAVSISPNLVRISPLIISMKKPYGKSFFALWARLSTYLR